MLRAGCVLSFLTFVLFLNGEQPHGHDPTGLCADKWKRGDLGFTDGFITQMYPFIALDMIHCNIYGQWGCKWCFHILDVYLHTIFQIFLKVIHCSWLFLILIHAIPSIR